MPLRLLVRSPLALAWLSLLVCLLAACGKADRGGGSQPSARSRPTPTAREQAVSTDFVGTQACRGCHREQFEAWRGSHHDLAMQPANQHSILGDFENAKLEHFGSVTRFLRRGDEYWVETDNAQGKPEKFKIDYAFGVYPLQQYLVAFPGGRYQALTVAWDSRTKQEGGQRWFHLQPDERVPHDDPLHWTGPYYNWNSRCAECHSTGLRKNYDAAKQTYATKWTEINVACEACHGPGSAHLKWATSRDPADASVSRQGNGLADLSPEIRWVRDAHAATAQPALGIGMSAKTAASSRQLDACGPCHSRRDVIVGPDEAHRLPAYDDGYVLSLPTPPLYRADGQILDEDYELGSFLQSKMHARGVACSNCHDPHSLRLKAPGNGVCAQCHNPAVFDTRDHHHHTAGSVGSLCADCHMPVTTYMIVDRRRDHSIRIPRPDLSVRFGTPNACTQCHRKKSNAWAANRMQQWLRAGNKALAPHFSDQLANPGPSAWLELISNENVPAIARAAALSRLAQQPTEGALAAAARQLTHPDPLVRRAALESFAYVEPRQRLSMLLPLASDPSRSVRMQVAALLAPVDLAALAPDQEQRLSILFDEYSRQMRSNDDMPSNLVSLGLFHTSRREAKLAEDAYRDALRLDGQFIPAYLNLADLYRQQAREDDAQATLDAALKLAPGAAAVHYALGLQRVRVRAYDEALRHLQKSHELAPDDADYAYAYALALFSRGRLREAERQVAKLLERRPDDLRVRQLADELRRRAEPK